MDYSCKIVFVQHCIVLYIFSRMFGFGINRDRVGDHGGIRHVNSGFSVTSMFGKADKNSEWLICILKCIL